MSTTPIFTLGEGRSGTAFLARLFRLNALDCVARHEPWPDLFGPAVEWHRSGQTDRLQALFARRRAQVERCGAAFWFEANHAFLKSFAELAVTAWPHLRLVRLWRDPRQVAKSYVHRWTLTDALRVPGRICHEGPGEPYIRWALTGREPLFLAVREAMGDLTLFQRYLVQWVEIEDRARAFLDRHPVPCFLLRTPEELRDPERLRELFAFHGVALRRPALRLPRWTNPNHVRTVVTDEDEAQFDAVVAALPARCRHLLEAPVSPVGGGARPAL